MLRSETQLEYVPPSYAQSPNIIVILPNLKAKSTKDPSPQGRFRTTFSGISKATARYFWNFYKIKGFWVFLIQTGDKMREL